MKGVLTIISLCVLSFFSYADEWTTEELNKANTGGEMTWLHPIEKEAIKYINLARLYPKKFADLEVEGYTGSKRYDDPPSSKYKKSLLSDLRSMEPTHALRVSREMYDNAKCFANESGKYGIVGHERRDCEKKNYGENCSYGMNTGKDICLQWLVDDGIASVGHRENCLDADYRMIGLSFARHKLHTYCSVAVFK